MPKVSDATERVERRLGAGLQAEQPSSVVYELSGQGLISLDGADAQSFLQGQLTNDLALVTSELSSLAAHCSPKGRVIATARVLLRGDSYVLLLPTDQVEPLLKRLGMFVLRAKVEFRQATDQANFGIAGAGARELLLRSLGEAPDGPDTLTHSGEVTAVQTGHGSPRFVLFGPSAVIEQLRRNTLALANTVDQAESLRLADIRSGIPNVYPATADQFLPQMLNLDLLGGVNFQKGCYVGQEVVARAHYLGKVKRRMYRVRLENVAGSVPPGCTLRLPQDRGGQTIGQVVDACETVAGRFQALAVMTTEQACDGPIELLAAGSDDQAIPGRLLMETLPYPFDA